jgi:hypothetical protein
MQKKQAKPATRRRVLARVIAQELQAVRGGHHDGTLHTFTRCDPDVCDYDID